MLVIVAASCDYRYFLLLSFCLLYFVGITSQSNVSVSYYVNAEDEASPNISGIEMLALHDLYHSTNGYDWTYNNWNFSSTANPCTDYWIGVTCDLPEPYNVYYVKSLQLSYNNLLGTLPPSLSNLNQCTSLDFTSNHLFGTIPDSFVSLVNLQRLYLADNKFMGQLPEGLPLLTSLRELDIGDNLLHGTIGQMAGLPLEILSVGSNHFTGTIPAELLWSPHINRLDLSDNYFHGMLPSRS